MLRVCKRKSSKPKFHFQKEEKQRKEEEVRHANEERIAESRQRSEREVEA